MLGYTTLLLDDAKTFSNFAKKKSVDVDDVKVAIQLAQDGIFCRPPPRDVRSFWLKIKFNKFFLYTSFQYQFLELFYVDLTDFNIIHAQCLSLCTYPINKKKLLENM